MTYTTLGLFLIGSSLLIGTNKYIQVFVYLSWSDRTDSPSDCPLATFLTSSFLSKSVGCTLPLTHPHLGGCNILCTSYLLSRRYSSPPCPPKDLLSEPVSSCSTDSLVVSHHSLDLGSSASTLLFSQ